MKNAFRRQLTGNHSPSPVNAPSECANLKSKSFFTLLGIFAMISGHKPSKDLSFAEMMSLKSSSRDRQVDAVYAADPQMLEIAAARAKAALRGNSSSIARPQRFSALSN